MAEVHNVAADLILNEAAFATTFNHLVAANLRLFALALASQHAIP